MDQYIVLSPGQRGGLELIMYNVYHQFHYLTTLSFLKKIAHISFKKIGNLFKFLTLPLLIIG